jgi:hypothetical protein
VDARPHVGVVLELPDGWKELVARGDLGAGLEGAEQQEQHRRDHEADQDQQQQVQGALGEHVLDALPTEAPGPSRRLGDWQAARDGHV